ncbi:type IV toxin-antitoxin system AbiEi family antitoxin domain-containing protein [Mycetocola zhujimingii]|uniref:AbiEi antitoxin C-terminal domain-containing protein n=1 Tax=Mycetocola zhujimingii TaxID=2079792 RepID=A0A2U1TFR3_9MICO|nr:hypothetical protein [Mycetocola zhujimingii]PWC07706.1 hypothetical protein DF223_05335 [Mycetocola zhujimingii]
MPDFIIRRHEELALGATDATLRRSRQNGEIVRIAHGSYARSGPWVGLPPHEQHRLRVLEAAERARGTVVYSHYAAAALWGIRILGTWPDPIDVTTDQSRGGRSSGAVKRHGRSLTDVEIVEHEGLLLTSPAQTVVDLARGLPFADGVVAMDSALHIGRHGAALTTTDAIARRVEAAGGHRGCRRAAAAAEFATGQSDSPEESHSRVWIYLLGFPPPLLQVEFRLPSGRTARPDFYWNDFDHAGECDGRAKYTDARYLRGRTPEMAVIDEKNRENELRQVVGRLSRWEPRDLYPPRRLYDRLSFDGLPSSKGRP